MANATYRGRIIVNDTDYTGSFVDPNPIGTATDTLTKLGIDGTVYEIQGGGGGSNLIVDAQIYSLEEKQVGVWTDGKPLYQKTFLFNQQVITDNAWTNNILGTVGSGIEIVDFEGTFGLENTNPHFANFSYYRGSSEYFTAFVPNNNGSNDDIAVRPNMNAGVNVTLDKCTIWYTKTTDTAGSGGFQAYGFTPIIYSTEEREVGVWIDNKPLYAKTYNFNSFVRIANSGTDISQYIDNRNDIEILVRGEGFSDDITQAIHSTALWVGYSTRGVIMAYCAEGATVNCVTLYYTKITDVAGSGSYTTLGVPAVHYSTDEQVIGTWTDGKPLYQKTYNINETIHNQDKTIDVSSLNIKKYINGYGTFMRNVNWASPIIYIETPFNLYESNNNHSYLRYGKSSNTIDYGVTLGDNETATDITITIQYTKTTD